MIYLIYCLQPSVEFEQPESKDISNLPQPTARRLLRASLNFMDVTLVTEDDSSKLQNNMSQSQEVDKGKAKKKTGEVKMISAKKNMEDHGIKMLYKDGIKVFKCDECGGYFQSMTRAQQHLVKNQRARSEDDQEDKESNKAKAEEEL